MNVFKNYILFVMMHYMQLYHYFLLAEMIKMAEKHKITINIEHGTKYDVECVLILVQ